MDQARPHSAKRRRKDDRALPDWPACSSTDTIRWRLRADPGQKRDTGDRTSAQRRLTAEGPLQKGGVVRLSTARGPWFSAPSRDRGLGKPDREAPALAQGGIIFRPIRDLVPLLRNMMAAVGIHLERHGAIRKTGASPLPAR
jgi:hypothetical protein